jgi:hypothetical protein
MSELTVMLRSPATQAARHAAPLALRWTVTAPEHAGIER